MVKTAMKLAALAGALAGLTLASAGTASAQLFDNVYGGGGTETGHGGVQQVSAGGYIAVGTSNSVNGGANDVYLVRTDARGNLLWSYTYDIGGDDEGNDIQECANGDFIVTGTTTRGACSQDEDLLLMRVNSCGAVLWAQTYGDRGTFEQGWDVLETLSGDGVTTQAGDIVVAGWTTSHGQRDGYIIRTTRWGSLIWDAVYDAGKDDYFYGVDEQQVGVDPSGGDIIAAGGSNGISRGSDYDGWIVRVSGVDGQQHTPFHKMAGYGGASDEEFRGVKEATITNPGDIVAVGYTLSTSPNKEGYIVESTNDICFPVVQSSWGDAGPEADEIFSVKEIPAAFPGFGAGEMLVSGTTVTSLGGVDAFLGIGLPGSMAPLTTKNYGGVGVEGGRSVSAVMPTGCMNAGFILCGYTESPVYCAPGDPRQLLLVKTNVNRQAGCYFCEQEPSRGSYTMDDAIECAGISCTKIGVACSTVVRRERQTWQHQVCFEDEGLPNCSYYDCDNIVPPPITKPGASLGEKEGVGLAMSDPAPNPLTAGRSLDLEYTLTRGAGVTITVTDLAGREIYRTSRESRAGRTTITLDTRGWSAGAYVVSIEADGATSTRRGVVLGN